VKSYVAYVPEKKNNSFSYTLDGVYYQ